MFDIASVPRICTFYGIVIEMYYGDHPPHFHARYGGETAKRTGDHLATRDPDLRGLGGFAWRWEPACAPCAQSSGRRRRARLMALWRPGGGA